MQFSVDKIILDRINVAYKDVTTGNDVKFLLGHFDTRIKDFDLDKMKFTIPKINLSGVNAKIIQTPAGSSIAQTAAVDTAVAPLNMDLTLDEINVDKVKVDYRSKEMAATVDLGKFLVNMDKIDLRNQHVGVKSIQLSNTSAGLIFEKPQTVAKAVDKAIKKLDTLVSKRQTAKGWTANLDKIVLTNNDIKFDNNAQNPLRRGLDFAHMNIKNLNAELENLAYNPDSLSGRVNSFNFSEKSGLKIDKLHTTFLYGPKNAYLKDLLVQTPGSVIQKDLQVHYPSIESLTSDLGKLSINANLDGSKLSLRDVLLLMPTMSTMEPFRSSPNTVLKINGRVTGTVANLRIPNIELSGFGNTYVKASATMRGLPDVEKAYFDLTINDFRTSSRDIARLVPKGTIPPNVSIPANMNLKGTFKGTMKNFNTKMNLRSSYGAVDLVAAMKSGKRKGSETYSANIKANNLNVGALTKATADGRHGYHEY
jgi:hypothetical protein